MNKTRMQIARLALVGSMVALLAACGGGGGGGGGDQPVPPVAQETVPKSASASMSGLLDYLVGLVGGHSDSSAPLDVSGFKPPKSETAEPVAVK